MKENLLQFIWKLKVFATKQLYTTDGEQVSIYSVGNQNTNAGPDFLHAKVKIGNQIWAGNVEIHNKSSNWYSHNHQLDAAYNSVILHVVWEHDVDVFIGDNSRIPTLELKNYCGETLISNYKKLFENKLKWINCEGSISKTESFHLQHWLDSLFYERMAEKSIAIENELMILKNHWEALLFTLLAKNFGMKVNGDAFLSFSKSFDFLLVQKLNGNQLQMEALFFGQAGLLQDDTENAYFKKLKEEYNFLVKKFKLNPIANELAFFRLRPNNFPTIRLSQLAMLFSQKRNIVSQLLELKTVKDFYSFFGVETSVFWETHYTFKTESKKIKKKLSKSFIDLLLINTLIPFKYAYLKQNGNSNFTELFDIMEKLSPEKNSVINKFLELKIKSTNAKESQALLQLKTKYCDLKRCLECNIGKQIVMS